LSKHSTKFHFDKFTAFIEAIKISLDAETSWTVESLEEYLIRISLYAKRQFKVKDALIFWVAHAKLQRQLRKKLKLLMSCMKKENKELKAKRAAWK
jgi:hypothetical protein